MMRVVLSAVLVAAVAAVVSAPGSARADEDPVFETPRRVYHAPRHVRPAVRHHYRRTVVRQSYHHHVVPQHYPQPAPPMQYTMQYTTTYRQVVVAPARVVEQRIPARYGTVYETVVVPRTVMVEPERVMHYQVPAQYATVAEAVPVAPQPVYQRPCASRCNTGFSLHHLHWGHGSCRLGGCW